VQLLFPADPPGSGQTGRNAYGIDVLPFIAPLAREISLYPDFRFKQTYLKNLEEMEKEYLRKRQ